MLLLVTGSPLLAVSKFVQGKLALDWRHWLTDDMLSSYFSDRAFYNFKIRLQNATGDTAAISSNAVDTDSSAVSTAFCPGQDPGLAA